MNYNNQMKFSSAQLQSPFQPSTQYPNMPPSQSCQTYVKRTGAYCSNQGKYEYGGRCGIHKIHFPEAKSHNSPIDLRARKRMMYLPTRLNCIELKLDTIIEGIEEKLDTFNTMDQKLDAMDQKLDAVIKSAHQLYEECVVSSLDVSEKCIQKATNQRTKDIQLDKKRHLSIKTLSVLRPDEKRIIRRQTLQKHLRHQIISDRRNL